LYHYELVAALIFGGSDAIRRFWRHSTWKLSASGLADHAPHLGYHLPGFEWLAEKPAHQIEGSTGRGNITSAPWVATFDRTVTTTATQGFYLVYLYSVDLRSLYLSLAFGTTQFDEYFSSNKEKHAKLGSSATYLQNFIDSSRPLHFGKLASRTAV